MLPFLDSGYRVFYSEAMREVLPGSDTQIQSLLLVGEDSIS